MRPGRIAVVCLVASFVVFTQARADASPETASTSGVIAFVRGVPDWPREDLFLVDDGGRQVRRLTRLAQQISDPAWSPDGRQLGYEISTDGSHGGGLWIMEADGSRHRVNLGESLTWSPNAKRIAFAEYDRFDYPSVFVANSDGSARRELVGDALEPAWSPDGRSITFLRDFASTGVAENDIFVTPVQGGRVRRLTRTPDLDEGRPSWSPDGRQLLYAASRGYGNYALYVMDADGTDRRMLMRGIHLWAPEWSPDGRKIVFSSTPNPRSKNPNLYVANADGSGKKLLVRHGLDPTWRQAP